MKPPIFFRLSGLSMLVTPATRVKNTSGTISILSRRRNRSPTGLTAVTAGPQ